MSASTDPAARGLIILGAGPFAEAVCEAFRRDSPYRVAAFAVDRDHRRSKELLGLPVLAMDEAASACPPAGHDYFAAANHHNFSELRIRFMAQAEALGYRAASYVSPSASIGGGSELGDHVFVGDRAIVEPFARVGSGSVLWHGCQVGHHSRLGAHCFVLGGAVLEGLCRVGDASVIGSLALVAGASEHPGRSRLETRAASAARRKD